MSKSRPPSGKSFGGTLPLSLLFAHILCGSIVTIIVKSFWDFENSSEALAFYGVYHRYAMNQVIHFFGVPAIFWSLAIFMAHIKLPGTISMKWAVGLLPLAMLPDNLKIQLNYANLLMDQQVAVFDIGSGNSVPWYGTGKILKFAALVHFLSWFVQIQIGHYMIEGAQPASLQNFGAALSVAPLFAFYEGLWLFGINRGLQDSTKILIDQYSKEICAARQIAMKACQDY